MPSANDALPALFLSDDADEIHAAAIAVAALSSGEVLKPEGIHRRTGKPERDGLLCARLFGPIDDGRCLCGKYTAPGGLGTRCDKCGVLCGPSSTRGERWGHIASAVGLVHPRLAPRIALALGLRQSELARVLEYGVVLESDGRLVAPHDDPEIDERGAVRITTLLGDDADLMLSLVPVAPPLWRDTRRDPQDSAYASLVGRNLRLRRLLELNAPQILLDNERRMAQIAWDNLYKVVRKELSERAPIVVAASTTKSRALLQAVYDEPDSDAARHAYAAHLTAEGDLRGEFITSQLVDPRRTRMSQREADLLRRDEARYLAPLARLADRITFRRGFPSSCRSLPAAADDLTADAWSTIEHLESDLPALITSPALRSLTSLTTTDRALLGLCRAHASLPQLHTLQLSLSSSTPPDPDALRTADIFPDLRTLTVVHRSTRGQLDHTWLLGSHLLHDVTRLTLQLAEERLAALDLGAWIRCLAARPRLGSIHLGFGKRLVTFELRRDREWTRLRVVLSSALEQRVALGYGGCASDLLTALTALGPHDVLDVRVDSTGDWYGEELTGLARSLRAHFADTITLPRVG